MQSRYRLDDESRARFAALFKVMGIERKECKACGAAIYFVASPKGKRIPYTEDGVSHFADCPHANNFRRAANS